LKNFSGDRFWPRPYGNSKKLALSELAVEVINIEAWFYQRRWIMRHTMAYWSNQRWQNPTTSKCKKAQRSTGELARE